jgi:peptidoglycan/LPS O-acetylase OafA/YrhL
VTCRLAGRRGTAANRAFAWLPWFCLVASAAVLALRMATAHFSPYTDRTHLFPTHLRVDSLLFGVLLSYYYHFHRDATTGFVRRFRWPLAAAALLLMTPAAVYPVWTPAMHTVGLTGLFVGSGLLLLVSLTVPLPSRGPWSLPFRTVGFVGAHSYAIYLWHMPVKIWGPMYVTRWFGWPTPPAAELAIYLAGSILLGIALSLAVEVPTLALRDWLFPSRSRPLAAPGTAPAAGALPLPPDEHQLAPADRPEDRLEVPVQ